MQNLIPQYDTVISIGGNCFPMFYIHKYIKESELLFFDHVGSSMWSIQDVISNDWKDLLDANKYELKNSLNFKDMINFYTASSDNVQIYNANNSDRKIKQTKRSININVI